MSSLLDAYTFTIAVIHDGLPEVFKGSLFDALMRDFTPTSLRFEGMEHCDDEPSPTNNSDTNPTFVVAEFQDFETVLSCFGGLNVAQKDRFFAISGVSTLRHGKRFSPFASGCIPSSFRAPSDESSFGRFYDVLTQHGQGVCVSASAINDLCRQRRQQSSQLLRSVARNLSKQISRWVKRKNDNVQDIGWCWTSDTGNRTVRWPWGYPSSRAHISRRLLMPAEI